MNQSTQQIKEGLTFDDVLLVPSYSEILPRNVDITSKFSRNIDLRSPVVSAAMDTVSESELAIALAQEGGIAVLHKNMTAEQQAAEVRKVKRSESGMIQDPVTIGTGATVGESLALMKEHSIGGIPVVDEGMILQGIVTNRDLRFEKSMTRALSEVMTGKNVVTTTDGSDLKKAEEILQKHKIEIGWIDYV
jgi:IMP dehydrogenase